jgi:signal transduction histidine kinase
MLHHPRNSALIGRLYISSEDSMPFEVKADREGFVKNDAFDALVKSIRLALQWMVLHYNKFLLIHATEILRDAERNFRKKIEDVRDEKGEIAQLSTKIVDKAVDVLSTEARRVFETLPDKEKGQSAERVEAATEVIKSSFSRAETYLSMLRAVASTGGFIFGFAHEIKVVIARLSTHANTINRLIGKMPPREKSEFINFANSLRETRDRFDKQIELFELLVMKTKDHERKDISLKETVAEVCSGFSYLIKHYGLDINKDDIPDSLKIGPMLDAEAFSIIVNLISNAIKATLAGNGSNISIQGKKDGDKKIIRVLDDGIGIHDKYREEVFQPLTADPDGRLYKGLRNKVQDEELVALGRGSGLGLSIVQGIVESYGGTVRFVDTKPPWKTCVEVVIP